MNNDDSDNKKVIITGFYSGIGLQTSIELARQGIKVIGIGRSENKAKDAIIRIKEETGSDGVEFVKCDLSESEQVKQAAEKIKAEHQQVDVLINNAGIINRKLLVSKDGLENTFAVSAMSSFLLTRLLLGTLLHSPAPMVINLTSEGYKQGKVDFEAFQGKKKYKTMSSYSNAKMAEMIWTYEMAERLTYQNISFRLVHPGLVPYTGGIKKMPLWIRPIVLIMRLLPLSKSLQEGAQPVIDCVLGKEGTQEKVLYLKEGYSEEPLKKVKDKKHRKAVWEFLCEKTQMPVKLD